MEEEYADVCTEVLKGVGRVVFVTCTRRSVMEWELELGHLSKSPYNSWHH